ncbi:small acid-soluble spore protein P [Paenibacillus beijingensis]|uniref:Spore protein n=1 Tax=Paenibacillus beijingensis TaxID=1126833 RepID=A0A0D5NIM6_9BACL|nr:small acid-soluble spore protein P [Paenibacillus beijingensis]AJY74975.1 spore protein [Paenibacillus beijingensis]
MNKPNNVPVPNPDSDRKAAARNAITNPPQEPMSGSKKTKQRNHVSHLNPEG